MRITDEQTSQANAITLECLNNHHQNSIPFQQVWTREAYDFHDVPFLDVWVIYDGEPDDLDIARLNSFDTYLMTKLKEIGIHAIPSISYVPRREADQLGTPWIG